MTYDLSHPGIYPNQAAVIDIEGKGLTVIAGCAHSGIINTVLNEQAIRDVEEIWAISVGFHLGSAKPEMMEGIIAESRAIGSRLVMPVHCAGFVAMHRFATEMRWCPTR